MMLITNRHNVTGRPPGTNQPLSGTGGVPDEVLIIHNRKGRLGDWVGRLEPLYEDDQPRWIEHPRLGAAADFVAIPLREVQDVDIHPYNLIDQTPTIKVGVADVISVVGFPFGRRVGGFFAIWATGFVASEPDIDYENLPVFLIDCRSRPGQSGSAVIAHRNSGTVALADGSTAIYSGPVTTFLGIYSGRISSESDLGTVWKASAVGELLSSV